jgi:hypothetical protein
MKLTDILADEALRQRFITGALQLVATEVASKSGLQGFALKAGYKTVTAVRPGILQAVLEMLLPHFAPAAEPHFAQAQASGDVERHFREHADTIANALLAVTDARAERAQNQVLKRTYLSLRGQAQVHTAAAMPGVGRLLASFT